MWHYLHATVLESGGLDWQKTETEANGNGPADVFVLTLNGFPMPAIGDEFLRQPTLQKINNILQSNSIDWIEAGRVEWTIDLGKLISSHPDLNSPAWLRGTVLVKPISEEGKKWDDELPASPRFAFSFDEELFTHGDILKTADGLEPTVFYSWQADSPNSTNRGFIEGCLEKAIKNLGKNDLVKVVPRIEKDTQGKPGSPDIAETIFRKIDDCSVFVADVTVINAPVSYVEKTAFRFLGSRLTPNPNVMLELGYAAKSIGWDNVILVMNKTSAEPEDLPFDLRKRVVVTYSLKKGQDKKNERADLVGRLVGLLEHSFEAMQSEESIEPVVEVTFADHKNQRSLGGSFTIEGTLRKGIEHDSIPDYSGGVPGVMAGMLEYNSEYYRDKAFYMIIKSLAKPVSFGVHNSGKNLLTGVKLVFEVSKSKGLVFFDEYPKLPWRSRKRWQPPFIDPFDSSYIQAMEDRTIISIPFGKMQVDEWEWSSEIIVMSMMSQKVKIEGRVFSDQSPPLPFRLDIDFKTHETSWTIDDLDVVLPEEETED